GERSVPRRARGGVGPRLPRDGLGCPVHRTKGCTMTDIVSSVLVVAGSLLALISAIGLHRFGDVFARIHAAGKAAPLGAALVFAAIALQLGEPGDTEKLALTLLLLAL